MSATDECSAEPGEYVPVIDHGKCEGKEDCVRVCPYDVFEVRRISDEDFGALGWIGKMNSIAHGRKTAYAVRAGACEACGQCVKACPEKAITLRAVR